MLHFGLVFESFAQLNSFTLAAGAKSPRRDRYTLILSISIKISQMTRLDQRYSMRVYLSVCVCGNQQPHCTQLVAQLQRLVPAGCILSSLKPSKWNEMRQNTRNPNLNPPPHTHTHTSGEARGSCWSLLSYFLLWVCPHLCVTETGSDMFTYIRITLITYTVPVFLYMYLKPRKCCFII